jgi:hypothetical protein
MLSFKNGRPIALIEGGEYDKKKLKLDLDSESDETDLPYVDKTDLLDHDFFRKRTKNLKINEIVKLQKALMRGREPEDDDVSSLYREAISEIKNKEGKELKLVDGRMFPLPNREQRECIYISAPSGAGKSTWAANYILLWKKMFPEGNLYIFSKLAEDEILDQFEPLRIKINETLIDDEFDLNIFEAPALVLFDDIDSISNKKIQEAVINIQDNILDIGRHYDIWCLSTSHMLMAYKRTRNLINESSGIVFFPNSGSTYHIKRFLREYAGLNKKQIERILTLHSRWIFLHKNYPMYIISEHEAYLIN